MAKFCANCGQELKENTLFCPECGKKVQEQPMTQQSVQLITHMVSSNTANNKQTFISKVVAGGTIGLRL